MIKCLQMQRKYARIPKVGLVSYKSCVLVTAYKSLRGLLPTSFTNSVKKMNPSGLSVKTVWWVFNPKQPN